LTALLLFLADLNLFTAYPESKKKWFWDLEVETIELQLQLILVQHDRATPINFLRIRMLKILSFVTNGPIPMGTSKNTDFIENDYETLGGTSINTDFPGSGNVTSRAPVS